MTYRLAKSNNKPWSAPTRHPRTAIDSAKALADHLKEPIVIWAQMSAGRRWKPCRRYYPVNQEVERRKTEKISAS
jgi:hypothetical protein